MSETRYVASCLSFAGRVLGIMALLLALLGCWGALRLYRSTGAFVQTAKSTVGTIDGWSGVGEEAEQMIRYRDHQNVEHRARIAGQTQFATAKDGDPLNILYSPTNARDVRQNSWFGLWGGVVLLASVATSIALAGALFFFGLQFLGRHIARSDWTTPTREPGHPRNQARLP